MLDPMGDPNRLLRKIGKERQKERYHNNGREIPDELWHELKAQRICDECKETFNQPLYIHHRVPVSKGGSSTDRNNLMCVCWSCHQKLDPKKQPPKPKRIHCGRYWRRARR